MSASPAATAYERAEDHFQRGDFDAARADFVAVLQFAHEAGGESRLAVISAVQRLAEIAVLRGEWEAAVERLELARGAFVEAGNAYMADYASIRIASVENARGMGRSAAGVLNTLLARPSETWNGTVTHLPMWEEAWRWPAASRSDRAIFFVRYYLEAGHVEAYGGQFERAVHLLRRGLDWTRTCPESGASAPALCLALASSHLQSGDVRSAALALGLVPADLDDRTQPGDAVFRLELKGRLDLFTGKLGAAKSSLERAMELCVRVGSQKAWRTAALNLSQVLVFLNQTADAKQLCEQVLTSARASGDAATEVRAAYLRSFADDRTMSLAAGVSLAPSATEMWLGRRTPAAAASFAEHEPTPFDIEDAPDYLTLFEERALGFFWLLSRGRIEAAAQYLEELERIFLQSELPTDSLIIRMRLHGCACMLAYYDCRYSEALDGFLALCGGLRDLGLKPDLWQTLRFVEWALIRLDRASEADAVGAESKRVLAEMSESLTGADLVLFLLNKWTDAERYMAGEVEALLTMKRAIAGRGWRGAFSRPLRRLAIARRLAALLDYADAYKAAVFERPLDQDPATPALAGPASLWRLLRHRPRHATIAWIVLPDITLVARAGWAALDFGVSGVSRLQLREWVRHWHESVRDGESTKAAAAMRLLADALQIEEIMHVLPRRTRSLTFVPDDVLHGVPFAAFRHGAVDEKTVGQYVGATHAVSISFDWSPRPQPARQSRSAVVVGVPDGSGAFDELPNAIREADQVAERLRACGLSVTRPGARAEILNQLSGAEYFHIACHGIFQADRPDQSGLVIVSKSGKIDILTIRDLAQLDLRSMRQAVLSSCWAADSYIIPGRWIVSIPSALCRRGARSVVASLWPIDDAMAERFVLPLYDGRSGRSLDERLLRVRREFINSTPQGDEENMSDPFFWAGVQLYTAG